MIGDLDSPAIAGRTEPKRAAIAIAARIRIARFIFDPPNLVVTQKPTKKQEAGEVEHFGPRGCLIIAVAEDSKAAGKEETPMAGTPGNR